MNQEALVQMFVSMRAQIDAVLILMTGQQAPEQAEEPKCPQCGSTSLAKAKTRQGTLTVCGDCGANF